MQHEPPTPPRALVPSLGLIGSGLLLILGFTYLVGAFLKMGQIREAGVPIAEVIPLVPLEDLLLLGIGPTLLLALIPAVFYVFILAALVVRHARPGGATERTGAFSNWSRYEPHIDWTNWALVAVVGPMAWLVVGLVGAVLMTVGLAFVVLYASGRMPFFFAVGLALLVVLAYQGADAVFFSPRAAPTVRIESLTEGASVVGKLLATDGGVWYVATPQESLVGVPVTGNRLLRTVDNKGTGHPAWPYRPGVSIIADAF